MEGPSREQLKSELKEEISKDIQKKIEEEVQEELEESKPVFSKFKGTFIAFLAIIMALGQYSEAVSLIRDGIDTIQSEFTNEIEYDILSKIHVGNTAPYMESLLGSAQVSRSINAEVNANYYYDDKYLLTLFFKESRVIAFTFLPLVDDFYPAVVSSDKNSWQLGQGNFMDFPANPKTYIIDHAKTASYYLESLKKGRTGLFVNSYLGKVTYTAASEPSQIAALYKEEVYGEDKVILKLQTQLRKTEIPNFYGEGELSLELIEKSILTGAEFNSYFGQL
jgi:hypothetical protein